MGAGASLKTAPIIVLAALVPTADSWRERGALVGAAVMVPLLTLMHLLVADFHQTVASLREHRALPGLGGLSLAAQPELAKQ